MISLVLPVSNYSCFQPCLLKIGVRINVTDLRKIFDITVLHVVGFSVKVLTIFPPLILCGQIVGRVWFITRFAEPQLWPRLKSGAGFARHNLGKKIACKTLADRPGQLRHAETVEVNQTVA